MRDLFITECYRGIGIPGKENTLRKIIVYREMQDRSLPGNIFH